MPENSQVAILTEQIIEKVAFHLNMDAWQVKELNLLFSAKVWYMCTYFQVTLTSLTSLILPEVTQIA
ncbi:hypothetical protein CEE45_03430 [Candidatus Heimdallarchaeota archaeon B3_Heim]|nr:MAG: hypothetical protein CEE45_03430 [Candidatus Heimdallarchaeota archaeon B3_Heim]